MIEHVLVLSLPSFLIDTDMSPSYGDKAVARLRLDVDAQDSFLTLARAMHC